MKYIMDIEEKPLCVFDEDTQTYFPRLWRVKGFNSLVLDEEGLSRLEELNSDYINEHFSDLQDTAYQRGLEDGKAASNKGCEGCEYAGKIVTGPPCITCSNSYKNQWTAKQTDDEIKVGDEVRRKTAPANERGGIVTKEYENTYYIMWTDGSSGKWDKDKVVKTGRHFDIASILKEMQS